MRKTMKIVEGRWDCPSCGTKGIKGHESDCPNCGEGKPPGIKHYLLPEDREKPLEGKDLENYDWNPNWICPYCGYMNPNAEKECHRCGHLRSKEDKNPFDLRLEKAVREREEEAEQKKEEEKSILPMEEPNSPKRKESHWREGFKQGLEYLLNLFKKIIFSFFGGLKNLASLITAETIVKTLKVLGILAIISFFIYLVAPKWVTLNVEGFKWKREVTIDKLQTVEESGYHLPPNARLISTTEEPDINYSYNWNTNNNNDNHNSSWSNDNNTWSYSYDDDDDSWWSSSNSNSNWSSSYDDDNDSSWSNWSSSYDDDDSWWSSSDSNNSWSSSYDDDDSWWSSSDSDSSWSSSYDDDDDWDWYYDYDDYDFENGYFAIYDWVAIPFKRFKIYVRHVSFNRTKYHYEIDKWVYDRTETATEENHDPYWPDTSNLPEDEKVSSQSEWYYVNGTDSEGKEYEFKVSYSDWQKIEIGDDVKFEVSFGGGVRIIKD